MSSDIFKTYNEMLKMFDSLAKREGELLQKLSQSEHAGSEQRVKWAEELLAAIRAATTLDEKRTGITEAAAAEINKWQTTDQRAPSTSGSTPGSSTSGTSTASLSRRPKA